jgi:hypothetical protein
VSAALDALLARMDREPWHVWWHELGPQLAAVLADSATTARLATVLAGRSEHERRWVAQQLALQQPDVLARGFAFLLDDPDDDVRVAACVACVRAGERGRDLYARLHALVRSPRLIVFEEAANTLAALADPELVATLESVFPCRDWNIASRASHRLGTAGADGVAALLRLSRHADAETRRTALYQLGSRTLQDADEASARATRDGIARALDDADADVRAAAAASAGRMGMAEVAPRLLVLADAATPDGKAALHALGQLTHEPAWPLLVDCLLHDAPELCELAARALAASKFAGAEDAICERLDRADRDHSLRWSLLQILAPVATSRSVARYEAFVPIGTRSRQLTKRQRRMVRALTPAWIHKARERG